MYEQNNVMYEYKTITVKSDMASLYNDNYKHFGWEKEEAHHTLGDFENVTIRFKRDRRIANKARLNELQNQFDACIEEIERLEKSKTRLPAIIAMVIGVAGTLLMGGAVFLAISEKVVAGILMAIPGAVLWGAPYSVYREQSKSKTAKVTPKIDQKFDELYDICQEARALQEG